MKVEIEQKIYDYGVTSGLLAMYKKKLIESQLQALKGGLLEMEQMLTDVKEQDKTVYNPEDCRYTMWHEKLHDKILNLITNLEDK